MLLKQYNINLIFKSVLKRATPTLEIILHEIGKSIPIRKTLALNERDDGELQGLNKTETQTK